MGFMMLQCGLGLFSLAVLHLVAHSLYKAHAFLSSGSVVDIARASWVPDKSAPRATAIALSVGLAVLLYAGVGLLFGLTMDTPPQVLTLGAILVMGLTLLMAQAAAGGTTTYVLFRTLATGAGVTVAYFALHAAAEALYAGLLPTPATPTATDLLVMILAVGSFGAVTVLQVVEPSRADSPFWRAARVHIANGLYVNAAFDRLIQRPAAKLK
jgi:NAD(P)H-quinone oxidoreductase subunit 5